MQLENLKEKKTEEFKEVEAPKTSTSNPIDQINKYLERPNEKELVAFLRELAILVEARVPLVRALNVIALHNQSKGVADMAKVMGRKIEDGGSLSEAMEEFRTSFSDLYIYVVKAGEASGRLEKVLEYLASYREKNYELKRQIQGALIYPIFILIAFLGVFAFLMIFVMPSLSRTLTESGVALPWTTKVIIGTSELLVKYWFLVIITLVAVGVGLYYYARTKEGKNQMDLIKLKFPVVKKVMLYLYVNRFTRNLSLLLRESVPITRSLAITGKIMDNHIYYNLALDCVNEVQKGKTISGVLGKSKHFPSTAAQIIRIGEEAGQTNKSLDKVSEYYDKELANLTKNMTSLIEPFLILILGVGTGILVASVIMPIYNMAGNL